MARTQGSGAPIQQPAFKVLDFTQAGAVQNTWYIGFQGTNAEFSALGCGITVANETVEMRFTIDGVVIAVAAGTALTFAANPYSQITALTLTTGTPVVPMGAAGAVITCDYTVRTIWLKGKNVKIELRKTTAGGASALRLIGVYHQVT